MYKENNKGDKMRSYPEDQRYYSDMKSAYRKDYEEIIFCDTCEKDTVHFIIEGWSGDHWIRDICQPCEEKIWALKAKTLKDDDMWRGMTGRFIREIIKIEEKK
jgi:hypothetical protein